MEIDQQVIYIVILVFTALSLLLVSIVVVYLRIVGKYVALKDESNADVARDEETYQLQARKVLEEANSKARNIVSGALSFKSEQAKKLEEDIDKAIQMYANQYQETIGNLNNNITDMLSSVSGDIKSSVSEEVGSFKNAFQGVINNAQTQLTSAINGSFENFKQQLEVYKNHRVAQLDESIYRVVEDVTRKVLSKEITAQEHEKLVIKALNEAKKEFGLNGDLDSGDKGGDK